MNFILNHLVWFVSLPTLAIAIALLVFVPGAWMAVLSFLNTTFGKILAILIFACSLAGFGGWEFRAYVDARAITQAERDRADAAAKALLAQSLATSAIETSAAKRIEDADRLNRHLQGKLDDYVKELAGRKGAHCSLTSDDVRSLRGIAGRRIAPRAAKPSG